MLTKKQHALFVFIQQHINTHGISPSFDDMRYAMGVQSKSAIHHLLSALERNGKIKRDARRARAIALLPTSTQNTSNVVLHPAQFDSSNVKPVASPLAWLGFVAKPDKVVGINTGFASVTTQQNRTRVPIMGKIAAGTPIEAISDVAGEITVPSSMLNQPGQHFALEVQGDSMIDAGINHGDVVIICVQDHAQSGDIVVALVDGVEATLKKFRRQGAMIALESCNTVYETHLYREEQITIQGRLVGLIRSYG